MITAFKTRQSGFDLLLLLICFFSFTPLLYVKEDWSNLYKFVPSAQEPVWKTDKAFNQLAE